MDRFEPNLRIPGPTGLPPSVREAGARQMINHRGPEFAAMLDRILTGMRPYFGTTSDIAIVTTAGTGGLEAAVVNVISPGDRVLGVSIGSFGDRFAKIARTYGADVTKIEVEWGQAADPEVVRAELARDPSYKAVLLTHNETSTSVMNPIAALAAVVRETAPDALILVDSVSGLGAVPFEMDAWGIDLVVTGSQKAWMSAPGLAMIAASERAWAAMETATAPRVYLDLRVHRESHAQGQTPWTPAIAVVYQVDEGIRLMNAEGAEHVFARHEACAAATRAGLTALGFELLADPRFASRTVTGALVPDDLDWKAFNTELKRRGLVLAGGQGKLTGKIFRLGHLGSVTLEEILGAMSVLEFVSIAFGRPVRPGSAVAAAQVAAHGIVRADRAGVRRGGCMRVLVAEPVAQEGVELLRARHEVDERPGLSRDELCAILPDYDALVVRSQVQVDAELIAAAPRLIVIGRAGVGVDNVDLEAATRAGIVVVNAPTGNTIAAAEHTLALLYGIARRTAAADASVRRGEWQRAQFTGLELRGRTLGIVGLGKIGQAIAVRARAMEMTVLGVDPFISAEAAANHGVELVEFDAMLARADVVTVHVPLTRATRGLIGREAIAKLRPGAIVLNVARGGVVDEVALAEALQSGHLAGAGIDVFEHEPPTGSPLLDAPNTLLTPHLGASTAEAQILVSEEVAAQVLDVLDGRSARYAVNAPLLTPETARAIAPYLPLAEILGRFFAQFSRGGVRSLTLEIAGELAELRRHAADRRRPARPARDLDDRAGQPRQRRGAGQGARHHRHRAQDARRGCLRGAADPVGRDRPRHDRGGRHGRRGRAPDHPARRLPARHGPGRQHAHHPPHGPARDGRAGRDHARRGGHQHQRDAPRPDPPARGRVHDPGPRRRRARGGLGGDPAAGGGPRPVDDPPGGHALTADRGPLVPDGLDATLVLVRHGESTFIAEGRFQGQADSPLTPLGLRQAALVADRLAAPHASPALPVPTGQPLELVHSPLARTTQTAAAIEDALARAGSAPARRPDPGFLEIHQGDWQGLHRDEITERYGPQLAGWRRTPRRGVGDRRRIAPAGRGARPARPRDDAGAARRRADSRAATTVHRSRATATRTRAIPGRSWSATTASSR